ncbi:alpha-N-acetylgalactosaminidase, partial [gut metagenome]
AKWNYFGLKESCNKRYVGVKVTEGHGGSFAAGSELDLFSGDPFTSCDFGKGARVKASERRLTGDPKVEDVTHDVNGVKKSGKLVTFSFEPFKFGTDPAATVEMKVVMYDGDHFMRKWIELKTADKETRVKFIDGERLNVNEGDKTWTAPRDKGASLPWRWTSPSWASPSTSTACLWLRVPRADTQIMDEVARSRYWTGKNFTDFERDGQLTKDGEFVSWETVCGATHSDGSDMNVIQTDFYAYITSISKPSDFRIQYNSWFDNMMFIDDENIIESFKAVDKELSETGVRPLESYVVDDGWNQYRAT